MTSRGKPLESRLKLLFIGLAVGPLLMLAALVGAQTFEALHRQQLALEQQAATSISLQVTHFFHDIEDRLRMVVAIQGLARMEPARRQELLEELLAYEGAFDRIALFGPDGRERVRVARLEVVAPGSLGDGRGRPEVDGPLRDGRPYLGTVHIDPATGEPRTVLGLALPDPRSGGHAGALVAEVRLKRLWTIVDDRRADRQDTYIVDGDGRVVAHRNPSVVLRGTVLPPGEDGLGRGIDGGRVLKASVPLTVHNRAFRVVSERPVAEAYELGTRLVLGIAAVALAALLAALVTGMRTLRRIVQPIGELADAARDIAAGNQTRAVAVGPASAEIEELADAFNVMTARLLGSVDELTRSNAELERFAYIASHDLQEPLRTIIAFSQLLERRLQDRLEGEDKEFLDLVVAAARRMNRLVHDLLAYSRLGAVQEPFAPVALGEVVGGVLADLGHQIAGSGARVEVGPLPEVMGDRHLLGSLVLNLLSNAIKFRRPGVPPEVRVSAEADGDRWVLRVSDNGLGIEPQYHDQIFVIFKRLHTAQAVPGTGIGLAICKRVAERHGGAISVSSQPGLGSTFSISLPRI